MVMAMDCMNLFTETLWESVADDVVLFKQGRVETFLYISKYI